jgi:hypothetical protein
MIGGCTTSRASTDNNAIKNSTHSNKTPQRWGDGDRPNGAR